MTQLATEEASRCWGFSKDHRRCRLVRRPGHRTCKVHKLYFKEWTEKHPPFVSLTLESLEKAEYRVIKEYKAVFENGFIDVHNYVHELPDGRLYNDMYVWIVSLTGIDSRANLAQFRGTVKLFLDDCYLLNSATYGTEQPASESDLQRVYRSMDLICRENPQIKLAVLFVLELFLLKCHREFTFAFFASQTTIEYVKQFLATCLDWPPFCQLFYSDFPKIAVQLLKEKYTNSYQHWILEELIQPVLAQQTLVWKSLLQSRCYVYKEELMMKQWHPDRVTRLLQEGWEDICD